MSRRGDELASNPTTARVGWYYLAGAAMAEPPLARRRHCRNRMAFRCRRRIRLAPGITLNLSKSTASLSLGPRGAKYTISPRGNRFTAGLPGTGLFYTLHDAGDGRRSRKPPVPKRDRLNLGFFQRLTTPARERKIG